ncbi:NAD(P)-binding protein [Wolfiporia cocos MD-104 SS10]|uniref:NAD(P)-binding protein n=1 Tax=Wolfiporia cocos (strain MD-104) TaxID=742152 RepID=A0A2H3JXA0_WOLCO|nr:NAD(P)-binding protein [Wolfiporia cocos MD-104 SS10]
MPAVTRGKVLVTGANGFVAAWVVYDLLKQSYSVRATVRSENKSTHLRNVFGSYGDRLEIVVVEDITKEGAFDEAVQGVDAIEHIASPCHPGTDDPQDMIIPAVNGTLGILQSARAHGSNVQRVVITSSCATIAEYTNPPRVFTEYDWNEKAVVEVKAKKRDAHPISKYRASKVLAERAAWNFVEEHKGDLQWDLVVLCPSYVFGPMIHEVKSLDTMNASMNGWYQWALKGLFDPTRLDIEGFNWVDVRDLANAHVLAIQKMEAAGSRVIVSQGPWDWYECIDVCRQCGVETPVKEQRPRATAIPHQWTYDTSKAEKILGIRFRSLRDSTNDIIQDLRSKGWIEVQ